MNYQHKILYNKNQLMVLKIINADDTMLAKIIIQSESIKNGIKHKILLKNTRQSEQIKGRVKKS